MDSFIGLFDPALENDSSTAADFFNGSHENISSFKVATVGINNDHHVTPMPDCLPSEPQEGNIEYKLKLVNPNCDRFKRLVSQMQWRLREGLGEAIYEIGVSDSGFLRGLNVAEMHDSMDTLKQMAAQLRASLTVIREKEIVSKGALAGLGGVLGGPRKVAEVLVRKVPNDQCSIELRMAVLGNSDVGKSTLLGVLTRGELDNGRGCARLNVFRHRHEVCSGKTSSVSLQIMGFNSEGDVMDQSCSRSRDYDDEDICSQSVKIINFIDLAGDQKYLKTTVFGLSGYSPHYAVLVVSAYSGVVPMTEIHLGLAVALKVPIVIVVTKTDMASSQQIMNTIKSLKNLLTRPGYKKVTTIITNEDEAITAGGNLQESEVVPIFCVSSVTGDGLALLKKFLFVLPPKLSNKERETLEQESVEFQIDEVFQISRSDGSTVVGGLLTKGIIQHGNKLILGPLDDCSFLPVKVTSVHRNKVPCRVVRAGQSASLRISGGGQRVRKGMKLVGVDSSLSPCYYFQAKTKVLHHSTRICPGFQSTVHLGNVRQTAVVERILGYVGLQADQCASVIFRFLRQPEAVRVGARLLFRQGPTLGIGEVTQVFSPRGMTGVEVI